MNKLIVIALLLVFLGCKKSEPKISLPEVDSVETKLPEPPIEPALKQAKTFQNARFKNVTSTKDGDSYKIQGEAQIFEASYSWVIEDGHNELESGHGMTDAGAPEWGKFQFTVTPQKTRENSTLTLILFEISAKDGSRQHELLIPLL